MSMRNSIAVLFAGLAIAGAAFGQMPAMKMGGVMTNPAGISALHLRQGRGRQERVQRSLRGDLAAVQARQRHGIGRLDDRHP